MSPPDTSGTVDSKPIQLVLMRIILLTGAAVLLATVAAMHPVVPCG